MNGPEFNPRLEADLRHKLTEAERAQCTAYLSAHPAEREFLAEDVALNRLLRQLPDKPLASNFTAQVLEAVARETARPHRPARWAWLRWFIALRWSAKLAGAALVMGLGIFSYTQYQAHARAELARNIARVSEVTTLVSPEIWQDFDAIAHLSQAQVNVDDDLLAALRQP